MYKSAEGFLCCFVAAGLSLLVQAEHLLADDGWLGPGGSNVLAVHALGEQGEGINIGLIAADNARKTHEAFRDDSGRSRVVCYDYTGEGSYRVSDHDTWVAGIVCSGGGRGHENDIGVAPKARLVSAKVTRGIAGPEDPNKTTSFAYFAGAVDSLVNTHRCRIIVTGLAFPDSPTHRPDGNSDWSLLYDYYAWKHNVIFANASGKEFHAPVVFGDSYNGITTGGLVLTEPNTYGQVGKASNSGPTIDGRRKPDVVVPADGIWVPNGGSDTAWYTWPHHDGPTSLAAPNIAGVAALLLGLADRTPEPNDARNVVVKAVVINAANTAVLDKAGVPTETNGGADIWHPDRGFGRIDTLRSYNLLKSGRVVPDKAIGVFSGWAYEALSAGQEHVYRIGCRQGDRLLCTLVWNRPVRWTDARGRGFIDTGELEGLYVSLTLSITAPGAGTAAQSNANRRDNVVKETVMIQRDGEARVRVSCLADSGERVPYGLAFEVLR